MNKFGLVLLLVALAAVSVMAQVRPGQPERITQNDPAFLDRQVREIYSRLGAYIEEWPETHTGITQLAENKDRDTVLIRDMRGNVTHYACDSCFAVFIEMIRCDYTGACGSYNLDSLAVAVTAKDVGAGNQNLSDSSFIIMKKYSDNPAIYWMTVQRR